MVHTKSGRCIPLWIDIYDECPQPAHGQGRRQVDGGCGLPHTAFLIGHRNYSRFRWPRQSPGHSD